MMQPEEVDPIEDVFQFASRTKAPAREEVIKRFRPVLQLLHLSLHDLPQLAPVHVDVVLEIDGFTCKRIPVTRIRPDGMTAVLPD